MPTCDPLLDLLLAGPRLDAAAQQAVVDRGTADQQARLAHHPDLTPDVDRQLQTVPDRSVTVAWLTRDGRDPDAVAEHLRAETRVTVLRDVAAHPNLPPDAAAALADHDDLKTAVALAVNLACPGRLLAQLGRRLGPTLLYGQPSLPSNLVSKVREMLTVRPQLADGLLDVLAGADLDDGRPVSVDTLWMLGRSLPLRPLPADAVAGVAALLARADGTSGFHAGNLLMFAAAGDSSGQVGRLQEVSGGTPQSGPQLRSAIADLAACRFDSTDPDHLDTVASLLASLPRYDGVDRLWRLLIANPSLPAGTFSRAVDRIPTIPGIGVLERVWLYVTDPDAPVVDRRTKQDLLLRCSVSADVDYDRLVEPDVQVAAALGFHHDRGQRHLLSSPAARWLVDRCGAGRLPARLLQTAGADDPFETAGWADVRDRLADAAGRPGGLDVLTTLLDSFDGTVAELLDTADAFAGGREPATAR